MSDEEKKEVSGGEYYFRGGEKFKLLVDDVVNKWKKRYGFDISVIHITNLIADKVSKAGGIRI